MWITPTPGITSGVPITTLPHGPGHGVRDITIHGGRGTTPGATIPSGRGIGVGMPDGVLRGRGAGDGHRPGAGILLITTPVGIPDGITAGVTIPCAPHAPEQPPLPAVPAPHRV